MPAKPITMNQIRQIIQLHQRGNPIRNIVRLTGVSRNTIRGYFKKLEQLQLASTALLALNDEELSELMQKPLPLNDKEIDVRFISFQRQLDYFRGELKKTGVSKLLLWEEYRKEYPDGYAYTRFCYHLTTGLEKDNAVMHFVHQPAELLQIDFAGDPICYIDKETGEEIKCQILVCVLPYSGYTYSCALPSQKQEFFLRGIAQCLNFLGGVPFCIKTDNLKSAVVKSNRYEPIFTESLDMLARHYDTTVIAARPYKPRDKAAVENTVKNVYGRVVAPLRHTTFFCIEQINVAMQIQNNILNGKLLQGKKVSRQQLFDQLEKSLLKPLPSSPFVFKRVTQSKVQKNYHVIVGEDFHHYSVPFALIGKTLKIVYCDATVEIYEDYKRVAFHKRNYAKHGYSTLKEHMPSNHKAISDRQGWTPEYFIKQAALIGNATSQVMETLLNGRTYREQSYNTCLGILRLSKEFSPQRLEAACQRMLPSGKYSYKILQSVLLRKLDTLADPTASAQSTIPFHENIRGAEGYN